ncbi:MAG: PilN domain-containing protein [Nitrosomonadales bacterium]|nr:PilN domain-containing protein [Nitrosomonadales bacterium]
MSQQINLYNPVFLKRKKYFSAFAMLQALLLIAFGSALFYAYAAYQVRLLAKQHDETGKRYTAEQLKLARYTAEFSPQQAGQLLEEELKSAEARAAAQRELIDTLKSGATGNTTGYSEYMRAFARQAVNGLWLTGFNITGDAAQISMSGAVLSPELLPVYVQRLGGEKVMRGKTFASLQMRQPRTENGKAVRYVEFTLQSSEDGGAAK